MVISQKANIAPHFRYTGFTMSTEAKRTHCPNILMKSSQSEESGIKGEELKEFVSDSGWSGHCNIIINPL